jgi:hypothetical protein
VKVHVNFARKVGRDNYGSENFSVAIESEPPDEVAHDREKLRGYVEELFIECKARVEDQIVLAGEREPVQPQPVAAENGSRRPPASRGPARPPRHISPNGNGRSNGNAGARGPANGESVSLKQLGFLRSLARDAGYSNDQLGLVAEEATGKRDLRELTKREASALIDQLRTEAA